MLGNKITDEQKQRFEEFYKGIINSKKEDFYKSFKEYFNNRKEFNSYIDNLKDRDKIIQIGCFYHIISKEINYSGVTLISIFSIMEALSTIKYKPFREWIFTQIKKESNDKFKSIQSKKNFKEILINYKNRYIKTHGSTEKVRSFIVKYFDDTDKERLVKSFKIHNSKSNFENLDFDKQLKAIIDMLYNERSAFVHQARLPQVTDTKIKMVATVKLINKEIFVITYISIVELQKMFERAFVKFIKNHRS